jgi:hypothetical protein
MKVLAPFNKEINVNARVMQLYVDHLLPGIAAAGDDNNYGSSAMYDGLALQVGRSEGGCSPRVLNRANLNTLLLMVVYVP